MSVTPDPGFRTECLGDGLTERNADVFDRVVRVDFKIAVRLHIEVDESVTGDLIEHVIEKRQARCEHAAAGAIEIDAHRDLGFARIARNARLPRVHVLSRIDLREEGAYISIRSGPKATSKRPRTA